MATGTGRCQGSAYTDLEIVENKIRSHVYSARIRISEHFKDFDRLHSGFISRGQFRRCLSQSIEKGLQLSEAEFLVLAQHYDTRNNGCVNYLAFIESIDKVFGGRNLEKTPTFSVQSPEEWIKDLSPLSATQQTKCLELIECIRQFVRHHGFDVKSWYRDFDKHNSGFVTVNQWRRGFPPNLLLEEDMETLLRMYKDESTDTVNYFKFNVHVNRKPKSNPSSNSNQLVPQHRGDDQHRLPVGMESLLDSSDVAPSGNMTLPDILHYIQKVVYVKRIRVLDLFRDYDHHRLGLVSEHQFRAGLKQSAIFLSPAQVDAVMKGFRCPDGRISYKLFCDEVDQIFTSKSVESDPTIGLRPPGREALAVGPNRLSNEDEAIFTRVTTRLREEIKRRRLNTMTFFKDFDKRAGSRGQITKSQFARLLSLSGLHVSQKELYVLLDKYQDPFHVNYLNFVSTVDPSYYDYEGVKGDSNSQNSETRVDSAKAHTRSVVELFDIITYQTYMKGLRISEFMRDFDRSKSGTISRADFIRALNHMGISFNPEEYEALCDEYKDLQKPDRCQWREFEADVQEGAQFCGVLFGYILTLIPIAHGNYYNLEKNPTLRVETKSLANHATSPVNYPLTDEENRTLEDTLHAIHSHLARRSTSVKTLFQSFDKLRTGHVTKAQVRQVLAWVEVDIGDKAFDLVCKRWTDKVLGEFCYLPFVSRVEFIEPEQQGQESRLQPLPRARGLDASRSQNDQPPSASNDIEQLLFRLKSKVKTERVRVHDALRDFDPLQCGRITNNEFQRAINRYNFNLTAAEMDIVAKHYSVGGRRDATSTGRFYVDYRRFSDDMEAVFTQKNLEGNPTAEPQEFKPLWHEHGARAKPDMTAAQLEAALQRLMHQIAEDLRQRRMYFLLRYLEDHDKIHNGTITRTQFRSAMSAAGCNLTEGDAELIFSNYALEDHDDHIDYLSFNTDLMEMSKQVWKDDGNLESVMCGNFDTRSSSPPTTAASDVASHIGRVRVSSPQI